MTTASTLHDAVLEQLRTIPHVTIYDGDVPDAPPAASGGRVYPYVVLWGSPGTTPRLEAEPIGGDIEGLSWSARVTVAAGDPTWCRRASQTVQEALSGYRPVPGSSRLSDEGEAPVMTKDRDVSPLRWYTPLLFTLMAP